MWRTESNHTRGNVRVKVVSGYKGKQDANLRETGSGAKMNISCNNNGTLLDFSHKYVIFWKGEQIVLHSIIYMI